MTTTWASLPPQVLARCLRPGNASDHSARFSTCSSFTKAMLMTDPDLAPPQITVRVDAFEPAIASVLRWAEAARLSLECFDETRQPCWLQPFLDLLQHEGVVLSGVRQVSCEGVLLDTDHLSTTLPNLENLRLENSSACEGSLSGCSHLQRLELDRVTRGGPQVSARPPASWYTQLASLPSLTSLSLNAERHPTSFLPLLAEQLTQLELSASRSRMGLLARQAAVEHTAQLTSLRALTLFECTAQELVTLSTLQQLQQLRTDFAQGRDSDAAMSAVLQFPHLTSLNISLSFELHQSHADQPCSWKELSLATVTFELLARLPLHSASVLRYHSLDFRAGLTVEAVCAAVDNMQRGQPTRVRADDAGPRASWGLTVGEWGEDEATVSSRIRMLLAIAPLVPQDITEATVYLFGHEADAALLVALQQVVPRTITCLTMMYCTAHPTFWAQLATSFPQLERFIMSCTGCPFISPLPVMAYHCTAFAAHRPPGVPRVADIGIDSRDDEEDGFEAWVKSFEPINQQLRLMGLKATVSAG